MTKIKIFAWENKSILLLIIFGTLSYGIYLFWMGFYWDDWAWMWLYHVGGAKRMLSVDAAHRPLSGVILYFGSVLFGQNPIGWQTFSFLIRMFGAFSLRWFLLNMWPNNKKEITWVAILFLLYPGFSQQFISVNNSRHLLPLITFFLSLGWMVQAGEKRYWLSTGISLLFSLLSLFSTEYYYGLELIRPAILWKIYYNRYDKNLLLTRVILKKLLPYLIPLLGIFTWRYTVSEQNINYPIVIFENILSSPLNTSMKLVNNIAVDIIESGLLAWIKLFQLSDLTLYLPNISVYYGVLVLTAMVGAGLYFLLIDSPIHKNDRIKTWITVVVGFALFVSSTLILANHIVPARIVRGYPILVMGIMFGLWALGIIFIHKQSPQITFSSTNNWNKEAIIISFTALLIAPLPFLVTNLDPKLTFPNDRLNLPMMFGSSLLLIGMINMLFESYFTRILIFSSIIGLSLGYHHRNAVSYRNDWNYQQRFFQQLTTRIPGLEPNTAVLSHQLRGTRSSDYTLTGPLNWIYSPKPKQHQIPYSLYYIDLRFGTQSTSLTKNSQISSDFLSYEFNGSTRESLIIFYKPPGCLRVLDKNKGHKYLIPANYPEVRQALAFSDLERIILNIEDQQNQFYPLFDGRDIKDWCYFFEKADLARQRRNWKKIRLIGDTALSQFELIENPSEYIPFIEGYALTGHWSRAESLTYKALEMDESITPLLCSAWNYIINSPQDLEIKDSKKHKIYNKLGGCK